MEFKYAVLWLRRLGIGRSLSAKEIIESMDSFLFPNRQSEFLFELLFDDEGKSLLLPLLPENHPRQFDEEEDEYWNEIEDLYPHLPIWCRGIVLGDDEHEELEFTQFDAIKTYFYVSVVVRYLLTPINVPNEISAEEFHRIFFNSAEIKVRELEVKNANIAEMDKYVSLAKSAVSNFSPQFANASAYFNRAVDTPNAIEIPLLVDWANQNPYKFNDTHVGDISKSFCEAVVGLILITTSESDLNCEFIIPSDLLPWDEDVDFLKELEILDGPWWNLAAFQKSHLSEVAMGYTWTKDRKEEFQRWIRIFDSELNPSKWSFYFWESPLDAAAWANSGFRPVEAAMWNSIRYDPFDAVIAYENDWEYSSVAPIVRAGMVVTDESAKLWGNAHNSSEILDAVDRGFPCIEEYQKYKDIESDFLTIQRFNDVSKGHLSIQELSRAIALEKSWMDIEDAVAWSKFDQPLSDVVEFKLAKQTPLQASKWIECGIPLSTALKWVSLGLSQKDALLWIEHDVDVNLAQWFLEHRIDNPREGKLWLKYIPKKEIPNWKAAEFDPISSSDWREIGFGPKTSLEWLALGVNSAKEAGEWLENKFELKEAIQWLERSISAENAKKWRDKGVGPDIAQRREQAGIKP